MAASFSASASWTSSVPWTAFRKCPTSAPYATYSGPLKTTMEAGVSLSTAAGYTFGPDSHRPSRIPIVSGSSSFCCDFWNSSSLHLKFGMLIGLQSSIPFDLYVMCLWLQHEYYHQRKSYHLAMQVPLFLKVWRWSLGFISWWWNGTTDATTSLHNVVTLFSVLSNCQRYGNRLPLWNLMTR